MLGLRDLLHVATYCFGEFGVTRDLRFFTAVKIYIVILWVVMPCSVVVGYQPFGGPSCLHLQCRVK